MDMITISAKTIEEAIMKAAIELEITSDKLEYEIVERGSAGFLGIGSRPAVIRARRKAEASSEFVVKTESTQPEVQIKEEVKNPETNEENADHGEAVEFLNHIFESMSMKVELTEKYDEKEKELSINMIGEDMGILIGKRGQTLDSLQYLVSLVVNKKKEEYIRVKLDTENYRARRKETLETLAKNIAYKVKRTKHPVSLEPMNPYERRIIHAALQSDRYVTTRSDGEEPFRHVIISLKRENRRERTERS